MAKRKKKVHHEEHPDERWLITYADVLTLMFVLFMVLFSISVVNTGKFDQLKESLSKGFNPGIFSGGESALQQGPTEVAAPDVETPAGAIDPQLPTTFGVNLASGSSDAASMESAQLDAAKQAVDAAAARAGVSSQLSATVDERGLTVRLRTDPFLFASGSAVLNPEARRLLTPLATAVRDLPNPVLVEGHTDSNPINTSQYPSNLFLGGARACAVLQVLQSQGLPGTRSSCASRGQSTPLQPNDTEAGRQANRRVEILVVRTQALTADAPATTP